METTLNEIPVATRRSVSQVVEELERLHTTHMELQTTKEVIKARDLSGVQTIILIHLSDNNSNEAQLTKEIFAFTGIITVVAKSGLIVNLNKEPF